MLVDQSFDDIRARAALPPLGELPLRGSPPLLSYLMSLLGF